MSVCYTVLHPHGPVLLIEVVTEMSKKQVNNMTVERGSQQQLSKQLTYMFSSVSVDVLILCPPQHMLLLQCK